MPKQKSHSGSKARVRVTKTGRVLIRKSNRNHNLSKKSAARKRTFGTFNQVRGKMARTIKRNLGI